MATSQLFAVLSNSIQRLKTPVEKMAHLDDLSETLEQKGALLVLTGKIANVSTAGQIYIPCPVNCDIVNVHSALGGVISGADAGLTVKAPDGTVGTVTIANAGSAAGDVDELDLAAANTEVDAGEVIEVETDGASTGAQEVVVSVTVRQK